VSGAAGGPWPGREKCAIAGVGATEFSRGAGRSELRLAAEAVDAALADAGIEPREVDGIVACDMENVSHSALADTIGVDNLTFWAATGSGGAAPCGQIGVAVAAILSGQASTVVCFRSIAWASGGGVGGGGRSRNEVGGNGTFEELFMPYGLFLPVSTYAMVARRHMIDYGTTAEQLGHIALTCRQRANANPHAQMHDRVLDMDAYLGARMVSSPLRLFDCCLVSDGACAVVVTSTERARDTDRPVVAVRAVAQSSGSRVGPGVLAPMLTRPSITTWPSAAVADTLYARAGLGPQDVDVAQIYDCFTPTVLIQLEDYGFCAKGEGGPFAASGAIDTDGSLPINTAGGNLSEGYIHGMNHVVEGVRQLRGESTSPVDGAEVCLVTSGPPPATSAMILTRAS
jgi:acetyl-CoA acetyltransferase